MGFDEEVDAARAHLEAALVEDETGALDIEAALAALLPRLKERIKSRRLTFVLNADPEDPFIEVVHTLYNEPLGYVFAEDGEFVFESEHEDYFDDFVDEDSEPFIVRLYETLRADLPKFEVEREAD